MATATPDVVEEVFALILDGNEARCDLRIYEDAPECPREARWAMRCPGCRADYHACDDHRTLLDREIAKFRVARCPWCDENAIPVPLPWRPI